MKCGLGTFTHSKPASKKKGGKDLFFMQPVGNITLPQGNDPTKSGNVYSENHGYPEKIQAFF